MNFNSRVIPTQHLNYLIYKRRDNNPSFHEFNITCSIGWPWTTLTGGHWASLSAATIWTLRCLVCDFPLVLISLVNTCGEEKEGGNKVVHWQAGVCSYLPIRWTITLREARNRARCSSPSGRRSWRRQVSAPGRSWTPGWGGWLCLHLEPPAAGCGPAQRYAPPPPGSGLWQHRDRDKISSAHFLPLITFNSWTWSFAIKYMELFKTSCICRVGNVSLFLFECNPDAEMSVDSEISYFEG